MKEFGLIGFPLGHSFSKSFFTNKFSKENIDACYINVEIPHVKSIREFIAERPHLIGLNCTIPHKEAIIPFLDHVTYDANNIGAVNVIKIERVDSSSRKPFSLTFGSARQFNDNLLLTGYNTDFIGFTKSISPLLEPHHKKALILGTGGAAKAVEYALNKLGITTTGVSRSVKVNCFKYEDITAENIGLYQIIVNCTPLGMHPNVNQAPPLPYEALTPEHLLYDLVYNPDETLFLKKGRQQGATIKNGLEMLELQAMAGWDIWNNQ